MKKSHIMPPITSAFPFPVFISSAIYNLVDLRAELKSYLSELGYNPYLSESEGFHSNTPDLSPYESCLKVLSTSFIMILVIDGKYGKKFKWPYWESIIEGREVSPTHGEYLLASKQRMKMLVFVRQEVLNYYQGYLNLRKKETDKTKQKEALELFLPDYISVETLDFLHEVKTAEPIPWLRGFNDITDIKRDLKSNMVNELAEIFLIKTQHLESVRIAFAKAIEKLSIEEKKKVLEGIGATKELIQEVESQAVKIDTLKKELEASKAEWRAENEKVKKLESKQEKQSIIVKSGISTKISNIEKELNLFNNNQESLLYATVSNAPTIDWNRASDLLYKPSTQFYNNQPLYDFYAVDRNSATLGNNMSFWEKFNQTIDPNSNISLLISQAQKDSEKFQDAAKVMAQTNEKLKPMVEANEKLRDAAKGMTQFAEKIKPIVQANEQLQNNLAPASPKEEVKDNVVDSDKIVAKPTKINARKKAKKN